MAKKKPQEPAQIWSGAGSLHSLLVEVSALTEDGRNSRTHPDRNLDVVRRSLQDFGQMKPIVQRDGVVVAGNATLRCARELGWTHIAAVDADHLTASQARAYGLVDNKSADLAEWDFEILGDVLADLPEESFATCGFDSNERDAILSGEWREGDTEDQKPSGGDSDKMATFVATLEQATIIRGAIEKVRQDLPSGQSDGRCLELICADYLSGAREDA